MQVAIAGSTGGLGREIVRLLGARAQPLTRAHFASSDDTGDGALARALEGADAVISALGSPVSLTWGPRQTFLDVDVPLHERLIAAATRRGVRRFVYVSVFSRGIVDDTAYVRAHRLVEERLGASSMEVVVIRPTGFMSAFLPFVDMARRGLAFLPGDGRARSNPIAPSDLAQVCVDGLTARPGVVLCGGPSVHTRREVIEEAFSVVDKTPRIVSVPLAMLRTNAFLIGPMNPRLRDLFRFVAAISATDLVAPTAGTTSMRAYFEASVAVANDAPHARSGSS
jgi:uncharacterized protein YbjT (DUF2867 family)